MKNNKRFKWIAQILVLVMVLSVFVPTMNVKAAYYGKYLIKINKSQNCVTVYERNSNGNYTPKKAMVCSTGVATPLGTFYTPSKYRWKILDGNVWGQYCTRITGHILFHSVWYYKQDNSTLSARQYNKLGTTASHGCVRLNVADAKWIYDNCSTGTKVIIYEDKNPGPLGKPDSIKIPSNCGWDPTDPDPKNPYLKAKPSISNVKNISISVGNKPDLKKNVTAKDSMGNNATHLIKITGKVNTKKAGTYTVTYSVTDALKRTTKKKIKVTVKDDAKPIIYGAKNQTVELGSTVNVKKNVTAKTTSGENLTSKIKVTGSVNTKKVGSYKITYTVTASNGKKATKTVVFTVKDTTAPVVTGLKDETITYQGELTEEEKEQYVLDYIKSKIKVTDNGMTIPVSKVIFTLGYVDENGYMIEYSVSDQYGHTTEDYVIITLKEELTEDNSNEIQ